MSLLLEETHGLGLEDDPIDLAKRLAFDEACSSAPTLSTLEKLEEIKERTRQRLREKHMEFL